MLRFSRRVPDEEEAACAPGCMCEPLPVYREKEDDDDDDGLGSFGSSAPP